jgi:hypothetical protein
VVLTINIINYFNLFPDEASCIDFIKEQRSQQGIICKKCTGSRHYRLENKHSFHCASCGFKTSIRSSTVMENSSLPIRVLMIAITFITATKKGFSAIELQKQLRMKRYEPVFRMYHKLRTVMGQRDDRYRIEDRVEYDNAYLGKSTKAQVRSKLKRGRGTEK